jgi:Cu(I)/Ag(I) efflux system periplasmic protein CusF
MKLKLSRVTAAAVATIVLAFAGTHSFAQPPAQPPAPTDVAQGEVRKIDKEAKKITIKHGEIKNLEMPPMTMVFQIKDAALLENLNLGDKIRFRAAKQGGNYIVTEILEP